MANTNTSDNMGDDMIKNFQEIEISKIDPFPNHPYKVLDNDEMISLAESIRDNGLLTPIIVNKKGKGRYELISGHRRVMACQLLGIERILASVLELNRDEATILMVESNIQREHILPSEKAFAYKMRLDAMNKQGKRTDLTSGPLGPRFRSNELLGEAVNESASQVKRFIRLTNLTPELLSLVDEGKMGLRPAVELSYISKDNQERIYDSIEMEQAIPSHAQAIRLRAHEKEGTLDKDDIERIIQEEKPNQKDRISFNAARLEKLFPKKLPINRREDYIAAALEFYGRYLERKERDYER